MVGILSTHLKSITIALARILIQCYLNGIAITVGHSGTNLAIKPCFICLVAWVVGHVISSRSILITNAVFHDSLGIAHTLEEIPSVIAIAPCTATDIMVTITCELLIGKTICVTSEVGGCAAHRLIVKIMMTIHIFNDVISAILHLASCVSTAINV